MSASEEYPGYVDEAQDGGLPPWARPGRPITRREAILRWIAFLPLAILVYRAAYLGAFYLAEGGWYGLMHLFSSRHLPETPKFLQLISCVFAAGLAGLLGFTAGVLTAPAWRLAAGAALLVVLAGWDGFTLIQEARHRYFWTLLTSLLESAANIGVCLYALRGMVRLPGGGGQPAPTRVDAVLEDE